MAECDSRDLLVSALKDNSRHFRRRTTQTCMYFTRSMIYSGNICRLPPVLLWGVTLTVELTGSVTLVRLGKRVLPLQKLFHLVVVVGRTTACTKKKYNKRPVCNKRHYFPSEWHFGLPAIMIPAVGRHRWSKSLLPQRQSPSHWLTVLHGSLLLVPSIVNQNMRF